MTSTYNSDGITVDRYADIIDRWHTLAKAKWGESVNLDSDNYLGGIFEIFGTVLAESNGVVQDQYDGTGVTNNTGVPLANEVELVGLEIQAAAYSTVTLTLTATKACTVAAGSRYATAAGVIFATDEELIFTAAGSDDVDATCIIVGANNAAIGEVSVIKTAVNGISTCTNAAAATPGRSRETSAELKARHTTAVATSGDHDVASIYEAVTEITGVSAAYVTDNKTGSTNADGVPSHHIYVATVGGDEDDVAAAIAANLTASVPMHGSDHAVSVYSTTERQVKTINYDDATNVPVYITVETTSQSGVFPNDGEDQIKAAIVAHFEDIYINDDVDYSALYAPIYSVSGHNVTSLLVDTVDPPVASATLGGTPITRYTIETANIIVTVS